MPLVYLFAYFLYFVFILNKFFVLKILIFVYYQAEKQKEFELRS